MFAVLISVLQLVAVINAFVRSIGLRFVLGIVGGALRALLLIDVRKMFPQRKKSFSPGRITRGCQSLFSMPHSR